VLNEFKHYIMKAYGGMDIQIHIFLTSALVGGEWSVSRPAALSPGKEPEVPIIQEGWWTPEPIWTIWRRQNSWPYQDTKSDPSVVHPVASRYTDCSTLFICTIISFNKTYRSIFLLATCSFRITRLYDSSRIGVIPNAVSVDENFRNPPHLET
jgi:hypothetical protein